MYTTLVLLAGLVLGIFVGVGMVLYRMAKSARYEALFLNKVHDLIPHFRT